MAGPFTNKDGEEFTREIVWNGFDANLRPEVVQVLNRAQEMVDFPIVITSGYRSPARNAAAGGAKKSQHMQGAAVDISVRGLSNPQRTLLTRALGQAGAKRLGAYSGNTAIHLDMASGFKPQEGYMAYGMFDRTRHKMDRAPEWFKAGLKGKIPPGGIPNVAPSAAPRPQIMSASLGNARNNPPPLPVRRPTTAAPSAAYDRSWMNDYGRILGQHQPQQPSGMANLGPPQFTNWQDDYNSLIAKANPMLAGARPTMREPVNPPRSASLGSALRPPSIPERMTALMGPPTGGNTIAQQRAEQLAQRQRMASLGPAPRAPMPATIPEGMTRSLRSRDSVAQTAAGRAAAARMAPAVPTMPAPLPRPASEAVAARMAAMQMPNEIPETEAERMFKQSQFALPPLPRPRPPLQPIPATMSAALAQSRIPMPIRAPVPMPAAMRPQTPVRSPLIAPQPAPRMVRAPQPRPHHEAAIARNGYVYAVPSGGGGTPTRVGTARPAGMTPAQQYEAAAARARASQPGAGGNPSWW